MNSPTVSILMVTYNHEKYIRNAIEGVLIQKTKFPIELIIGEDHSTDSTREICKEYESKYREVIRILDSEKNIGGLPNFIKSLAECNGRYVALCEGDDYWTDPYKLQKQVDFLEYHKEYALVCTNKKVLLGDAFFDDQKKVSKNSLEVEDLILSNPICVLTVMVETEVFKESVKKVYEHAKERNWQILDYPLWIYIAMSHKIGFLNDVTGVYRFLPESISHSLNPSKSLSFDKWGIDVREFYYKEYLKGNPNVNHDFKLRYKENIFHLKKRLLVDYGFVAKREIFPLLKTNPQVYLYMIQKKLSNIMFSKKHTIK
jgi:glycosyltransferase involved in cell wall biosynthesis